MDAMYDELIKAALGIATAVLAPLLTALIVQTLRKVNFQLSAEQQAQLDHWVRVGIAEAEEWGARRIKAQIPTDSTDKLERAVASILDRVPGLTRAQAIAMVHAALPTMGAGAVAAIKSMRSTVEAR